MFLDSSRPAIRVRGLRKSYDVPERDAGIRTAATSLVRIEPTEIVGFLGPNGAGKTTTLTVPVETLVGRLEPTTLVLTIGLAVAFLLGSRWFWKFGLRHYTGASA